MSASTVNVVSTSGRESVSGALAVAAGPTTAEHPPRASTAATATEANAARVQSFGIPKFYRIFREAETASPCRCEPATPRAPAAGYGGTVTEQQNPTPELSTHGVGPWPGEWPDEPQYDPELLERGDTRNVIDRYRYWRMEAIVADLDEHRHPFHVAIENWQHDMNIGSIVRSANAFAADTVHIIGRKRWNKRGAMVTDRYQHVVHHPDVAAFVEWARTETLPIIAIDNVPGSVIIETFTFPERCVLLFGQEGPGPLGGGHRRGRRRRGDQPVRLHPLDQRLRRRRGHHARLDIAAPL